MPLLFKKGHIPWNKNKQFCPKGHDTFITGRNKHSACKICCTLTEQLYRQHNKEKEAERRWKYQNIKNTEGTNFLKWSEFEKMYKLHNSKCQGCNNSFSIYKLVPDHDHKTNRLRFILCRNCNTSLGLTHENPNILINLAKLLTGGY
jgi:hypothetical protein